MNFYNKEIKMFGDTFALTATVWFEYDYDYCHDNGGDITISIIGASLDGFGVDGKSLCKALGESFVDRECEIATEELYQILIENGELPQNNLPSCLDLSKGV